MKYQQLLSWIGACIDRLIIRKLKRTKYIYYPTHKRFSPVFNETTIIHEKAEIRYFYFWRSNRYILNSIKCSQFHQGRAFFFISKEKFELLKEDILNNNVEM